MQITKKSPQQKAGKAKLSASRSSSKQSFHNTQAKFGGGRPSQLELSVQKSSKLSMGKTQAVLELKSPRTDGADNEDSKGGEGADGSGSPTAPSGRISQAAKQPIFSKISPEKKIELSMSISVAGQD